jgi:hypothetical protein
VFERYVDLNGAVYMNKSFIIFFSIMLFGQLSS